MNAAVGGGSTDSATGTRSGVVGGFRNRAAGTNAFVGGGIDNKAFNDNSAILGAVLNYVEDVGVVVGGEQNSATSNNGGSGAAYSFVGAGFGNHADGNRTGIVVGTGNHVTGTDGVIAGGTENMVDNSTRAMIGAGFRDAFLAAENSFIGGGHSTKLAVALAELLMSRMVLLAVARTTKSRAARRPKTR